MEHLVADVELELFAAARVHQLGLCSGEAQRNEVGAGSPRVDAIVEGEVEPPQPQGEQRVSESLPVVGELVNRNGGGRGKHGLPDNPRVLEPPEPVGEAVGSDGGEGGEEMLEALGPQQQLPDHEDGPALAEDVEGAGDRAHLPVGLRGHPSILAVDIRYGANYYTKHIVDIDPRRSR